MKLVDSLNKRTITIREAFVFLGYEIPDGYFTLEHLEERKPICEAFEYVKYIFNVP
jgi:hypothetical protein